MGLVTLCTSDQLEFSFNSAIYNQPRVTADLIVSVGCANPTTPDLCIEGGEEGDTLGDRGEIGFLYQTLTRCDSALHTSPGGFRWMSVDFRKPT